VLVALPVLVAAGVIAVVVSTSDAKPATPTAQQPVSFAKVEKGTLTSMVSEVGTLTHRARSDGSPYTAINQARGTYTELPDVGDKVSCGDELYRVDDQPVLLLCGTVPAYRDLRAGDAGNDVRQLNANLHARGADVDPDGDAFTWKTVKALEKLQHDKGLAVTGSLAIDDAVFLPDAVRIAKVIGQLGGPAQPGAPVLDATSDTLEVHIELEASQQGAVKAGDRVQITLPSNTSVTGKVDRLGAVAHAPAGPNGNAGPATIPAYISLDDPAKVRGLDEAPVQVEITTQDVDNALSVPVTAIVGRSGGGYAVEVARDGERRELVAVELGLFDTAGGRVQVDGDLREGDHVVVPSS